MRPIATKVFCGLLLVGSGLGSARGAETAGDRYAKARAAAAALYEKACKGDVDQDAYADYKMILINSYLPVAKEYLVKVKESEEMESAQKDAKVAELEKQIKQLGTPVKLCENVKVGKSESGTAAANSAAATPTLTKDEVKKATDEAAAQKLWDESTVGKSDPDTLEGFKKNLKSAREKKEGPKGLLDSSCDSKVRYWPIHDCNESFSIVGGVEQSGFSSLGNSTNAFLSAFTRAPASSLLKPWGRIRLLGAPQQSNDNIITTFTDPSGAVKKGDFTKIGQAIDYVVGLDYQMRRLTTASGQYSVSLIAGFGATTPLSSDDVVLRYKVPGKDTAECTTLIEKFSAKNGYSKPLEADPTGASCLNHGYQFIAQSNQDRTNFLKKYGAGIRTISRFCAKPNKKGACPDEEWERGIVDFTIGQDQAITGGVLKNLVFKVEGVHPLQIPGTSSLLYLFGSVSIRTARNRNNDPLILQSADASQAPVPSNTVFVLPLKQADRDFYRFGFGLNISGLVSAFKTDKKDTGTNAAAPTAAK